MWEGCSATQKLNLLRHEGQNYVSWRCHSRAKHRSGVRSAATFFSACFLSGSIYGVVAQNLPTMLLSTFLYRIIPLWHFWEKSWQKITSFLSLQWQNSCISFTRYTDLTIKYAHSHDLILHFEAANPISSFSPEELHCTHTWNHSGNPGHGLQECDSVDHRSL